MGMFTEQRAQNEGLSGAVSSKPGNEYQITPEYGRVYTLEIPRKTKAGMSCFFSDQEDC